MPTCELSNAQMPASTTRSTWLSSLAGRCFLNPLVDYALIGGGLSLLVIPYVLRNPHVTPTDEMTRLLVFLTFNYAHFAASTVRLYSKPGNMRTFRFLCCGFPLVVLSVLTLAVVWPSAVGKHLWALFLTWSPFHYAAQAYGLAVMYCYRSGCTLRPSEKSALWWISMLPFFQAFASAPESGIAWFIPLSVFESHATLAAIQYGLVQAISVLIFLLPVGLYLRTGMRMPLMSLLLLFSNGVWWITLSYTEAWFWATIFHAIQYLAIVMIFHVKDQMSLQQNRRGPIYHAFVFYGLSWLLGYSLFLGVPAAYRTAGFDGAQTGILVAAAMSIHHFVVDGYIWRGGKKSPRPASDGLATPAAA